MTRHPIGPPRSPTATNIKAQGAARNERNPGLRSIQARRRCLTVTQIVRAYDVFIDRGLGIDYPKLLFEDVLCYLTWCDNTAEARARLDRYIRTMSGWGERVFHRDGGKDANFEKISAIPEDPETLRRICEEQIKILNVSKLPDYGLSCN